MSIQEKGGDEGGSEAYIILSFLNLPNSSTFKRNTIYILKDKLGMTIEKSHNNQKKLFWQKKRLKLIENGRGEDFEKWEAGEKMTKVFDSVV